MMFADLSHYIPGLHGPGFREQFQSEAEEACQDGEAYPQPRHGRYRVCGGVSLALNALGFIGHMQFLIPLGTPVGCGIRHHLEVDQVHDLPAVGGGGGDLQADCVPVFILTLCCV